jgi:hypothetical protein
MRLDYRFTVFFITRRYASVCRSFGRTSPAFSSFAHVVFPSRTRRAYARYSLNGTPRTSVGGWRFVVFGFIVDSFLSVTIWQIEPQRLLLVNNNNEKNL